MPDLGHHRQRDQHEQAIEQQEQQFGPGDASRMILIDIRIHLLKQRGRDVLERGHARCPCHGDHPGQPGAHLVALVRAGAASDEAIWSSPAR